MTKFIWWLYMPMPWHCLHHFWLTVWYTQIGSFHSSNFSHPNILVQVLLGCICTKSILREPTTIIILPFYIVVNLYLCSWRHFLIADVDNDVPTFIRAFLSACFEEDFLYQEIIFVIIHFRFCPLSSSSFDDAVCFSHSLYFLFF